MSDAEPGKRPRVLVADDDRALTEAACGLLEGDGCETVAAPDGIQALERFREGPFDLVVLDVRMPGLDGFAVCERIRALRSGERIPVLMMTSREDVASIDRAFACGASDFLTKPIHWPLFRHRVRYVLRAGAAMRALDDSLARLANAQRIARIVSFEWRVPQGELHWSGGIPGLGDGGVELVRSLDDVLETAHPEDRPMLAGAFERLLDRGGSFDLEHRILGDGDEIRVVQNQAEATLDEDGTPLRVCGTLQDITDHKETEAALWRLAHVDGLTGLSNRSSLSKQLNRLLQRADRARSRVAVLFVDLDHFKRVNDSFGHPVGDKLLKAVASRITDQVRPTDSVGPSAKIPTDGALARLGGDEFTVLLPDIESAEHAGGVARRILRSLETPFEIDGRPLVVSASIGIALYPEDGLDSDKLLRNADTAMYHAKERGRNSFQFYADSMNQTVARRLEMDQRLRRAVAEGSLHLDYQPKLDVASGRLAGFEALLRWTDPEEGPISPAEFIPVAEDSGQIVQIGEWVLRTACEQMRAWQDAGYEPVPIAVNVSPRQLNRELPELVEQVLRETRLDPAHLVLEITESAIMRDEAMAAEVLSALRRRGTSIALDDFGTGYSSLAYLRNFELDEIKVDRSFVAGIEDDAEATAIVSSIIGLGRGLSLRVVAEGVELPVQTRFLEQEGCDLMQGFLLGRPAPAGACEALLRPKDSE